MEGGELEAEGIGVGTEIGLDDLELARAVAIRLGTGLDDAEAHDGA